MVDVYEICPQFENDNYILRMICIDDTLDLLKVYSDKEAIPFFNSDNCGGDDFHYTTEERMRKALEYWLFEYNRRGFVRWGIVSKQTNEVIGTIELFHRTSNDYFTNCGLLRLDLRSDYEKAREIEKILVLLIEPTYTLFDCDKIATKAIAKATERINALDNLGFKHTYQMLTGHDGTKYSFYYVLTKEQTDCCNELDVEN